MTEVQAPSTRLWSLMASVSRLHIVAIAAMGTLTFSWVFFGFRPWSLALICGFDWFIVNLLNRVVDLKEDKENQIVGTSFVERNRRGILIFGLGALILSFAGTILYWPGLTPWRLGYHFLGLIYNWALIPGMKRLKELYFFKNTASACGFLITVFAYPISTFSNSPWVEGVTWETVIWALSFFFLFELSYEVIYDLRDIEGDRLADAKTYPVVHGEKVALLIVDGLIGASMIAIATGYCLGQVPWALFVMIAAPALQFFSYKKCYRRGLTAFDCIAITWLGVALLSTYHVWIWLELPGVTL